MFVVESDVVGVEFTMLVVVVVVVSDSKVRVRYVYST